MADGVEEQRMRYEQAVNVASAFWEWRNKLMRFVFTGVGGALVATAWMYDRDFGRWLSVPLLFGGLLSVGSAFLDRRSGWIVGECYRVGRRLEEIWQPLPDSQGERALTDAERRGIFSALAWSYDRRLENEQGKVGATTATKASARSDEVTRLVNRMWVGDRRTFGTLLPWLFAVAGSVLFVLAVVVLAVGPHKH
jgi:hypothetical protein